MSLHLNPEGLAQRMSYNTLASEPSQDLWTHVASHSHVHYTFLLCCTPPLIPMPTPDMVLAVPSAQICRGGHSSTRLSTSPNDHMNPRHVSSSAYKTGSHLRHAPPCSALRDVQRPHKMHQEAWGWGTPWIRAIHMGGSLKDRRSRRLSRHPISPSSWSCSLSQSPAARRDATF